MKVQTVKEFVLTKYDVKKIFDLVGFIMPHVKDEDEAERKQINILINEARYTDAQFKKMLLFLDGLKPRIVAKRDIANTELGHYTKDQVDHKSMIVRPYDFYASLVDNYTSQLKTIDEIKSILTTQTEEED